MQPRGLLWEVKLGSACCRFAPAVLYLAWRHSSAHSVGSCSADRTTATEAESNPEQQPIPETALLTLEY